MYGSLWHAGRACSALHSCRPSVCGVEGAPSSAVAEQRHAAMHPVSNAHASRCLPACPPADNLQTRLTINVRYYHDLSVDVMLHLSVYNDVKGVDINIDNHKAGRWGCWGHLSLQPRALG